MALKLCSSVVVVVVIVVVVVAVNLVVAAADTAVGCLVFGFCCLFFWLAIWPFVCVVVLPLVIFLLL